MKEIQAIPRRVLREMKIISDQKGIMERYLTEAEGWREHLARTRAFILDTVAGTKPATAMVCGSGWLLDLPLKELAGMCGQLYLADIRHPVPVKRRTGKIPSCRLIRADLTGGAVMGAYRYVQGLKSHNPRPPLSSIPVNIPRLGVHPDLFISLNILNQMDILLVDYLKRFCRPSDEEISGFRKRIQQNHLDLIGTARTCLISDTEEIQLDERDVEKARKDLILVDLPVPEKSATWTWDFDRSGTYNRGMMTRMIVRALEY